MAPFWILLVFVSIVVGPTGSICWDKKLKRLPAGFGHPGPAGHGVKTALRYSPAE